MCEMHLSSATFVAEQDGNTLGTTSPREYLNIHLETQLPGITPFWVIETEGWSFDDFDELVKTLQSVKRQFTNKAMFS